MIVNIPFNFKFNDLTFTGQFYGLFVPFLVIQQGALIVVRDKMLRPENGDRLGVNDKLVLVTDGLSDIRPDLVEEMAMVNFNQFFYAKDSSVCFEHMKRTANCFYWNAEILL